MDIRHEAGSRRLEAGWLLHHVQEMLGHASIFSNEHVFDATKVGLHESMQRCEDARCKPVAKEATIEHRNDSNADSTDAPNPLVN